MLIVLILAMYCLVKFVDDGIYYVTPKKGLTAIDGVLVWAPYKRLGYYEAELISSHEDRKVLIEEMKKLEHQRQNDRIDNVNESNSEHGDEKSAIDNTMDSVKESNNQHEENKSESDNGVDDSDEDPHFVPEDQPYNSSSGSDDCSGKKSQNHLKIEKTRTFESQHSENINSLLPNYSQANKSIREVPTSHGAKKYCCVYCSGMYSKLVKHLECVHKREAEVKMFMSLPSKGEGSKERKSLIANIRNRGSYMYNTDPRFNSNQLIVTRRPTKTKTDSNYYRMCPQCKGLFSKMSIRKHYRKCMPKRKVGDRSTAVLGRQAYGKYHTKACPILREEILPVMRDDEISSIIRYDELIILYGNSLCNKYRSKHFHKMIRSKLRLIGRLMNSMKTISHVSDFASIYNVHLYDRILKATNEVALLNEDGDTYKSPATASSIGTLLKKCGKLYVSECIKKGDEKRQTEVENFLKVIEEEFATSINRIALENQKQLKRQSKTSLPSMKDISHLYEYVKKNEKTMYEQLIINFDFNTWKNLASFTLSAIQIFNRRRSGEIERMLIPEFNAYQGINNEDPDLILALNEEDEINAEKYVRCSIRGKLARGVPVLLDKETVIHIKTIISLRKKAGVSDKNLYVFGLPHSKSEHYHLDACKLLRTFSNACGASNPESLRGTKLRKKLCTQSAALNLHDNAVSDLANFMGHADKIHHEHYRLPIISRDIARVSNILEIGVSKSFNNVADDSNDNNNNLTQHYDNVSGEGVNNIDNICQLENADSSLKNSNSSENEHWFSHGKRKNSSISDSPYRILKRRSWSTPEKCVVMKAFKSNVELKQLPSLRECADLINCYEDVLQNRTPSQIKAWVSNKMKEFGQNKSRVYWSTEEKLIMRKEFGENLENNVLPALARCEEVRAIHKVLSSRSAKVLKAWVYNQINRQKKN